MVELVLDRLLQNGLRKLFLLLNDLYLLWVLRFNLGYKLTIAEVQLHESFSLFHNQVA